ncbi:MFS transporter [Arthrobacter sp. STN4]|uniref:MFS transporter n=1 Tax=Arthrobacter sp. STN4 TaxID=2923276 RepID=UPI00211A298E|nr:MFS transporter [Arthrobacter sp. STN4]MCQ9163922.1 MFS transporter [Arthrobacter sp. STN4]
MTTQSATPMLHDATLSKQRRGALRGGIFGYYVDQFDIFLPIITLAPAMSYFNGAGTPPQTVALFSSLIFISTLIARPLGAAFFGHIADKTGRRLTTLVAIGGFGMATLLMALLPGFETAGHLGLALLIGLRFIGGFFLGGEYSVAIPLAMEWAPKKRPGPLSGMITSMASVANVSLGLITFILLSFIPSAGHDSAYAVWGWRIPFLLGAVLATVLFFFYRKNVHDAPGTETAVKAENPIKSLFTGVHRRSLIQIFILMTGMWILSNLSNAVLTGRLKTDAHIPDQTVSIIMTIAPLVTACAFVASGALSQKIGRRWFYRWYAVLVIVVAPLLYIATMSVGSRNVILAGVLAVLVQVTSLCVFAPVGAYLCERFPSSIRASGYGVGYSLAVIIPAFYAFYIQALGNFMPDRVAVASLICLAGILVWVGATMGPETKDVDLNDDSSFTV